MRAVAQDREIASLMGIDVDRVIVDDVRDRRDARRVAGVLYAMTFGEVGPTMGFLPGIAAFTAAVLGGIGSIPGAALGGAHPWGSPSRSARTCCCTGVHAPSPFELKAS